MKNIFLPLMILLISFLGFAQQNVGSAHIIKIEDPLSYLPDYLENVYIGMPLAEFESIKDTSSMNMSRNTSDADMWVGVSEEVESENIGDVVYKFDKEENGVNTKRPLYQINIQFLSRDYEDSYLNDRFGDPQSTDSTGADTWTFKTDKGYMLVVKRENKTVEIHATMAGTEYDPKNNRPALY